MFGGTKYITKNISEKIPLRILSLLFKDIEKMKGFVEVDYLQIFYIKTKFINNKRYFEIKHNQEVPVYINIYTIEALETETNIDEKIYIIETEDIAGSYSTVLLAEEY